MISEFQTAKSTPMHFGYSDEFSVFIRVWPQVTTVLGHPKYKEVIDVLEGMIKREEDVLRCRIKVPSGTDRADVKLEVIKKLFENNYQWVPNVRLFDKVKGRVFCIVD